MTKYKVIKKFLSGPEIGTVWDINEDTFEIIDGLGNKINKINIQFLLDGKYIVDIPRIASKVNEIIRALNDLLGTNE